MKVLYFDCFAGIAGNMVLGALLDLGLDPHDLEKGLRKLPVGDYRLKIRQVHKQAIRATWFEVILTHPQGKQLADAEFQEVDLAGEPGPKLQFALPHAHDEADTPTHPPHRSLTEILEMIAAANLPPRVQARAHAIFTRLGEAEARVHGQPLETVHLHEVGGTDAIVDIVGTALGLELLGIEEVLGSPLHLGSGFVKATHGLLPIPAPATAQLLRGIPVYATAVKGELVTPTGAAIIATIAKRFGPLPPMKIQAIGYGAGSRDRDFPNVLRAYLGEEQSPEISILPRLNRAPYAAQHTTPELPAGYHTAPATVIEANLDDMQPQLYEALLEKLLEANALDVTLTQAHMKKNRPGMRLQVLAAPETVDTLLRIIFTEATTIGVRTYEVQKRMLQRELILVQTRFGPVPVKLARLGNQVVNIAPEYEACRGLAHQIGVPVKEIYTAALAAAAREVERLEPLR